MRKCEKCKAEAPCLWDDGGSDAQRYLCRACHSTPTDPFFAQSRASTFTFDGLVGPLSDEALYAVQARANAADVPLLVTAVRQLRRALETEAARSARLAAAPEAIQRALAQEMGEVARLRKALGVIAGDETDVYHQRDTWSSHLAREALGRAP